MSFAARPRSDADTTNFNLILSFARVKKNHCFQECHV